MTSKEIKKDAKVRTTGKYINLVVINILYSLFTAAFSLVASTMQEELNSPILSLVVAISLIVVSFPLSYGVIVSTMKIVRNENVSSTEFLNIGLQNIGKIWKLFFRTFLKLIVPFLLLIVSIVLFAYSMANILMGGEGSQLFIIAGIMYLVAIVYFCIKALSYTLSYYILYDNPDKSNSDILNESEMLMKGNKLKYIGLVLSFIGWYLLLYLITYITSMFSIDASYVVSFILSAVLTPYIAASQIVFYEDTKDTIEPVKAEEV